MVWTVDHIIFFAFLILNIILGLKSSKNITSITQYAIGDRNFSTGSDSSYYCFYIATLVFGDVSLVSYDVLDILSR